MALSHNNPYSSLLLASDINIGPALLLETSPLEYQLQDADFHVYTRGPGLPVDTSLDNATGISMAWALKRLIRFIFRAGCAQLIHDPNLPAGVYPYIPPHMFDMIGMKPPHILSLFHLDTVNMLSMMAPRATIEALWRDFQEVGHNAIAWIDKARERSRILGPSCEWDWEGARITNMNDLLLLQDAEDNSSLPDEMELGYPDPEYDPITCTTTWDGDDYASMNSDPDFYMSDDEINEVFNNCRDVVLHPYRSRIAALRPHYNVFGGGDLVDEDGELVIVGQY